MHGRQRRGIRTSEHQSQWSITSVEYVDLAVHANRETRKMLLLHTRFGPATRSFDLFITCASLHMSRGAGNTICYMRHVPSSIDSMLSSLAA
jgi:hypothetical protein